MVETDAAPALDFVPQETLDALHAAFHARISATASDAAARLSLDQDTQDALADFLLAAARARVDYSRTAIDELAAGGAQYLQSRAAVHRLSPFQPAQEERLRAALPERRESPAVAKAFGDKKRLYMRLVDPGVSTTQKSICAHLERAGYAVDDYKGGYATKEKQTYKIGKLLKEHALFLYERFLNDASRVTDNLMVVISRDADDIARMSANRGWPSCMAPHKGEFDAFVHEDIRHGTLIAYLVSENDPEINKPLARLLLKPYTDQPPQLITQRPAAAPPRTLLSRLFGSRAAPAAEPQPASPDTIYVPEGKGYGLISHALRATVEQFAASHLNQLSRDGGYFLSPRLYCDSNSSREVVKAGPQVRILRGYPG